MAMKQPANTSASASTSSASSTNPNPTSHGLRTQLGHLIPRHALFQVHLHIEQLSNVPLIKGEFGIRWKFKNVQSGSGLLSKMKAHRSRSGQSKGRGHDGDADGRAEDADEGATNEADVVDGDSIQDTTEDDSYTAESPTSPHDPDGHHSFDGPHPSQTPTPIINPHTISASSGNVRSEARGMTPWAPLQSYNVKWDHSVNVVVQMDVHRETGDLLPNELKLTVMQRVIHGDVDAPQQPRLGVVYLNLAEYADNGKVTRRYLLRQSKTNATLKLSIELEHIGGEKSYKPPPLRKGEILASVSGILSNNGLFNTRFARELDLYVGADKTDEDSAFPYADKEGHVQSDRLAVSYGLRTTETLIEALFNPVPSDAAEQTPFTYYAPPQLARPESPSAYDDSNDASGSNGRRSVDSSAGSASYVASTSEHSSFDPGMAADAATMSSHRHWWQKIRSRPSTPASRTTFRPATPAPPIPVRQG